MFKKLRIQNFKGWKDTREIEMKPITLFFGTNSSGKSSIGHFLMMLKQTMQAQNNKEVLFLGDREATLQLGAYEDMIFSNNKNRHVIFDYEWKSNEILSFFNRDNLVKDAKEKDKDFYFMNDGKKIITDSLSFHSEIGIEKKRMFVENFKYKNDDGAFHLRMEKKGGGYEMIDENKNLERYPGRNWPFQPPIKFYGFPASVSNRFKETDFLSDLNLLQNALFERIHYLGPLREKAERSYPWNNDTPIDVGYSGQSTIFAMLSARRDKKRIHIPEFGRGTMFFEETIAHALKKMELVEDIAVEEISKNAEQYAVKVKTKGSKKFVNLVDVGFGISQVLPVLVQCFYAEENSIIIIEQPEIHLHPAAQSLLADVMIDVIKSGTKARNANPRNIQLIIETHSEHFLQRLQRRIAEDEISEEDISAYFAKMKSRGAELEKLNIDKFGTISNWPENFFGDEMEDIRERANKVLERRMAGE